VPDGPRAIFGEPEKQEGEFAVQELNDDGDNNKTLYFITPPLPVPKGELEVEERRVLSRLPLLAIFHGVSHERGVPPSFTGNSRTMRFPFSQCSPHPTGFLRQWPSLPTFGVFLTTKVLPVPRVESADRYVVSRVEVLPGFFGVVQYLGFRDQAALHMDDIVARISALEERHPDTDRRAAARARIEQLEQLSRHPTHVCVLLCFFLLCGETSTERARLQYPALRAQKQERRVGPVHGDRELPSQCAHRRHLRSTQ
jgi:hypothetical protein